MGSWITRVALLCAAPLVLAACGAAEEPQAGTEVVVRVGTATGEPVTDDQVKEAMKVFERVLDAVGADGTVTRDSGALVTVLIRGADPAKRGSVADVMTRSARLELFDLERNLRPPSIDESGLAVPTSSLYELLVGQQVPVREREVESWYLFDADRRLAGGPAQTKKLLLANGALLDGWRILGVPPGTAVLECGVGEVVCPGVNLESPKQDFYYLVRFDPPQVPELTGADLELEGTRQDFDTTTGEPIVTIRFTSEGGEKFQEITNRLADRGRLRYDVQRSEDPYAFVQHFAIVLDREIKSWPSVDFMQYPNGIGGENGAQITGIGDLDEAKAIAAALQVGATSLRFEEVSRRELG
jgi:preprotein translocase subunit SecD